MDRRTLLTRGLLALGATSMLAPRTGDAHAREDLWDALRQNGHIAIMRHSRAPGSGDLSNFTLGDCSTQRNLDDRGRAQAVRVGERLRAENVPVEAAYSSRWCRCTEIAELLGLGRVQVFDALNSEMNLGPGQTVALAEAIQRRGLRRPIAIYVTHSSNIRGLLGMRATSGELIVARNEPDGSVVVAGWLGVI